MIRHVAVIVPAADEEDRIADCLLAIEDARRRVLKVEPGVVSVEVVVVLDACSDQTPAIVARFTAADHVHAITSDTRRVGAARRQGALKGLSPYGAGEQVWLANTDADSTVPHDWLTGMVAAANTGVQLVLGTVMPGPELSAPLQAAWAAPHRLTEGHPHIHGANFGIRADTYLELGGWNAELACNEDIDLASRAVAAPHIEILRTATIPVVTSARSVGRAPNGFSSYIRHLREAEVVRGSGA